MVFSDSDLDLLRSPDLEKKLTLEEAKPPEVNLPKETYSGTSDDRYSVDTLAMSTVNPDSKIPAGPGRSGSSEVFIGGTSPIAAQNYQGFDPTLALPDLDSQKEEVPYDPTTVDAQLLQRQEDQVEGRINPALGGTSGRMEESLTQGFTAADLSRIADQIQGPRQPPEVYGSSIPNLSPHPMKTCEESTQEIGEEEHDRLHEISERAQRMSGIQITL